MPDITLPTDGQKPWGNTLRTAINAINDQSDADHAVIDEGRLSAAALNSTIAATIASPARGSDGIGEYQWIYPQAIYVTSPSPRTLVGFISSTKGGGLSDVGVFVFDHLLRAVKRVVVGEAPTDDHNVPSVQQIGDGRIVVSWTDHNVNNNVYVRVTDPSGDLATLTAVQSKSLGGLASYTQVHLDPADPSSFWLLSRRWVGAAPYDWIIMKGTVGSSGAVTWGTIRSLLLSTVSPIRQPYITSVPTDIDGDAGIRIALTDNPTNGSNVVHYGTVNLVTGAVESPGMAITASVIDGTGLPLAFDDFDEAFSAGAGKELRVFAVRSGGDPAVLVAVGEEATFDSNSTYKQIVRSTSDDPGLHVEAVSAYVSTPHDATFDVASLKVRWYGTVDTFAEFKDFVRKYVKTGDQRSFQFRALSTGVLRLLWYPTGTVTNVTVDSTVAPSSAAVGFGFDLTPNAGSGYELIFYETLDGETWTQVGATRTGTASTLFIGTAPVEIGEGTASARGTVRKVEFYAAVGSATVIAGPDFTDLAEWADGDTAGAVRDDAYGIPWTITGDATIEGEGWVETDFGSTGASVAAGVHSYVAGMAYPVPSRGDLIYIAREDAGTWTIEKWSKASGMWALHETLAESDTSSLIRPIPAVGGGPFDVIYSDVTSYAGYTSYEADVLGVA